MGRPIRIRCVLPRTLNASGSEKSCRKGSPPQQDRVTRKQMESSAALSEAGALVSYFAEDREAGFVLLCTGRPRSAARILTHHQEQCRNIRNARSCMRRIRNARNATAKASSLRLRRWSNGD